MPQTSFCHSGNHNIWLIGAERMLGTNPIAIAFPGQEEPPIVIDMATSVVAYGKVEEAQRMNKSMPEVNNYYIK